jgi:hypothetical protein
VNQIGDFFRACTDSSGAGPALLKPDRRVDRNLTFDPDLKHLIDDSLGKIPDKAILPELRVTDAVKADGCKKANQRLKNSLDYQGF